MIHEAVAPDFADLGVETDLIPCGALASEKIMSQIASDLTKDQYIVVNFQASGANEDWGQGVNKSEWRRIVVDVVSRLSIRHKVVFLARSDAEASNARGLLPNSVVCRPKSITEYAK